MRVGLTKLVFVIDRSLSMKKNESFIIEGLNGFFNDQKSKRFGTCSASLYRFNDRQDAVFENINLDNVITLTTQSFQSSGSNSLLDAIGTTITTVDEQINALPEEDKPDRILIIIWTSGLESDSRVYTRDSIHNLIQQRTLTGSWDFAYVSTIQDESIVGNKYGVSISSSSDYVASAEGVRKMFEMLGKSTTQFRSGSLRTRFQFENKRDV